MIETTVRDELAKQGLPEDFEDALRQGSALEYVHTVQHAIRMHHIVVVASYERLFTELRHTLNRVVAEDSDNLEDA